MSTFLVSDSGQLKRQFFFPSESYAGFARDDLCNRSVTVMCEAHQNYQAAEQIEIGMTKAALSPACKLAMVKAPRELLERLRAEAAAAAAAARIADKL